LSNPSRWCSRRVVPYPEPYRERQSPASITTPCYQATPCPFFWAEGQCDFQTLVPSAFLARSGSPENFLLLSYLPPDLRQNRQLPYFFPPRQNRERSPRAFPWSPLLIIGLEMFFPIYVFTSSCASPPSFFFGSGASSADDLPIYLLPQIELSGLISSYSL